MEQITPEAHGDQIKKERESIAASAILFKGKIYTGVTHGEAILKFEERFPNWKKMKIEDIIDMLKNTMKETFNKGLSIKTLASTLVQKDIIPELYRMNNEVERILVLSQEIRSLIVARTETIR